MKTRPDRDKSHRTLKVHMEGTRIFLICIALLVVVLLVWMSKAELSQVVRVEGKIIPAGRGQQVQHLEGGIISKIYVQEGDPVSEGDLLLTIDGTLLGANLSESKIKLNNERARSVRLQAEMENSDTLVFPEDLASLPVASAETNLFRARRDGLRGEIEVQKSLLEQRQAEYREAQDRQKRLNVEMATATERLDIIQAMASNGSASKLEVIEAKSRQESLKTQLGEVSSIFPKLEASISEGRARIESAHSNFKTEVQKELVENLGEIERLQQILTAATDRMTRTDVRAPVDGVVNSLAVNTVGGVIKPGDRVLEITPKTQSILIEARVLPKDRGNIKIGLDAQIRVSAYDIAQLGTLEGRVTKVGADSVADAENNPYYSINIAVDAIPARYEDRKMVPGMTATADIVTGHRTILAYLLSPITKFSYNVFRDPR